MPLLHPVLTPRVAAATCRDTLHLAASTNRSETALNNTAAPGTLTCLEWHLRHPLLLLTVTAGHSLGGALAQLAAYEIKMNCANFSADVKVSCYILGAPRVGNAAFAQAFKAAGGLRHC